MFHFNCSKIRLNLKFLRFSYILIFYSLIGKAQENSQLINLSKSKKNIESRIQILQDSLLIVNMEIKKVESSNVLSLLSKSQLIINSKEGAKLKRHPDPLLSPYMILNNDLKLNVIDYADGYFGVIYDTTYGYLNEIWIKKDSAVVAYVNAKAEQAESLKYLSELRARKNEEQSEKQHEQKLIQRFGVSTYKRLKVGEYWLGMSEEMAVVSLGYPDKKNRSVGSWGVHEQWIFNGLYLYFENGKLNSYQERY
jgi:hypothetical protein